MPLRDAWPATRALVKGVAEIATKLNEQQVDHGWYPPDIGAIELSKQAEEERASRSKAPEHAIRKLTRPYEWLRREAISNLRIMQALSRPRMPRRVLMSGQGDEAAPGGFGCKRIGPTGRLARYYAACYVEIPWAERQQALAILMKWFGDQTTKWIADECARAGLTTPVPEEEVGSTTAPGLPRREEPGPREQEPQPQPQVVSPMMDIYHECVAEGCDTLVCNGGERQHMQSPYCSDACWHEHEKDGRVHGPADTKAWAEDTTNALWRRGRLTEMNVDPRGVGTL